MNLISIIDLAASFGSIGALLLIFLGARRTSWKPEITLFGFIIILAASHDMGNFLEWAGFTNWFDPVGDFLEILTAALWAFFFYTFFQELTERELRRSEEKYRRLFETGSDAVLVHTLDPDGAPGTFVEVNDLACERLGYSREEMLTLKPSHIDDPDLVQDQSNVLKNLEMEGKALFERVHVARDGRKIPVEIASEKFDLFGQTLILSIVRDITSRKDTEAQLKEIQELDEKILDGSPVAFVLHDLDMRIIRVSSAYEKVTGFHPEDVLGRTLTEFMPHGPQKDGIIQRMANVVEMGVQVGPQDIKSPKPGRYLRETILPISDSDGRFVNTLTVLEDITEQKQARSALEESEARYKLLFDSIHDGVVVHEIWEDGRPGRFLEVNLTFCQMTGYNRKELLKMSPLDLVDPADLKGTGTIRNALLGGRSAAFERVLTTKTGSLISCEMKAHSFKMGDQGVVLSVVRDITERIQAQDRIKNSLAEKETLLREVHHRVKNNLQVISGLLNLQSHYIDDEEVRSIYKESQNRIKTMALIHEELYQREDLARINLAEYIKSLSHNLLVSYATAGNRVKLTLDLADSDISIDTAIPCGLIVNELVSNALKHAFPGDKKGEIKVSLNPVGGKGYELTVQDNGVGIPEGFNARETGSLGLRLVSILAEQLGGDLQVENNEGALFSLTFSEYLEAGTEIH